MKTLLVVLTALSWATLLTLTLRLWGITDATAHIAFVCSLVTLPIPALAHYLKRPPLVTLNAAYVFIIVLIGVLSSLRPHVH